VNTGAASVREYRRSIGGIAISHFYLRLDGSAGEQIDYVLNDNLGSAHTLLDELGQITYRVGFDAHGSRREGYDPRTLIEGSNPLEDVTDRGFTGHEHLDALGVIHMNGRIYDPKLGRFLQADPLIQDLGNSQSLNRYTYVFNNPLAYTDPTGYSALGKYLRPILSVGVAWATGGWAAGLFQAGNTAAALAVSIGGGALAGAIATGSGKGALIGAFTGAAAFGVGSSIASGNGSEITNSMMRNGAESLIGGFQNMVNHGNYGSAIMVGFSAEWEHLRSTAYASNGNQEDMVATTGGWRGLYGYIVRKNPEFFEDMRTNGPLELAMFAVHVGDYSWLELSVDENKMLELIWRRFAESANRLALAMTKNAIKDFYSTERGASSIMSQGLGGRLGVVLGALNSVEGYDARKNVFSTTQQAMKIFHHGPQFINENGFERVFGAPYSDDPRILHRLHR